MLILINFTKQRSVIVLNDSVLAGARISIEWIFSTFQVNLQNFIRQKNKQTNKQKKQ
jgi:hypothetical protein